MGIELSLQEAQRIAHSIGVDLSTQQLAILLIFCLAVSVGVFQLLAKLITSTARLATAVYVRVRRDQESKDFIQLRNRFATHCMIEIERLNQESDWNDFYYTKLEAEVEVEQFVGMGTASGSFWYAWLHSVPALVRSALGAPKSSRKADSLVDAIRKSPSRTFLVIGEPGAGKTVSLRHLALQLAKGCVESSRNSTPVPLYLNLKRLNVSPDKVTAESIHTWVLTQLQQGQDRLVYEFLRRHFDRMLQEGGFFFLFDSFDEIPAVMDAYEDAEVVKQYALALSRFLHAPHTSRGLVASRPYRAPKILIGQRMIIRPLGRKRIQSALKKYLVGQGRLAGLLWHELLRSREDLLGIAGNPFYLGLLARYAEEKHGLPDRQFDLFEHFIQGRVHADADRLRSFGFTPNEIVNEASQLAYTMMRVPEIGLESQITGLTELLCTETQNHALNLDTAKQLLNALTFSKLARQTPDTSDNSGVFSFVHRRFHEYFCARFLRNHPEAVPISRLIGDNRWREILILLCEVLHIDDLDGVLGDAEIALREGSAAISGTSEHRRAIETLRVLKDGFRSRIEDLPYSTRKLCTAFIERQFDTGNELDQKRSIEGVIVTDKEAAPLLLERALNSRSEWLREAAIHACRNLSAPSEMISRRFRAFLYSKYSNLSLLRDMGYYNTILSSPASFLPIRSYLDVLVFSVVTQLILYVGLIFWSAASLSPKTLVALGFAIVYFFAFAITMNQAKSIFPTHNQSTVKSRSLPRPVRYVRWLQPMIGLGRRTIEKRTEDPLFDRNWAFNMWYPFPMTMLAFAVVVAIARASDLPLSFPMPEQLSWRLPGLVAFLALILNFILIRLVVEYPSNQTSASVVEFLKRQIRFVSSRNSIAFLVSFLWLMFSAVTVMRSGFSMRQLQQMYPPILAWILVAPMLFVLAGWLTMFLFMVPFSVLLMLELPAAVAGFFRIAKFVFRDQSRLVMMSVQPSLRPHTAAEAVVTLNTFRIGFLKAQYVSLLMRWLPYGEDWNVLIQTANLQQDSVRDRLFILAEIWEDSASIASPTRTGLLYEEAER